ncbi:hypothetical protein H8957_003390 [Semnopithecus entellus]
MALAPLWTKKKQVFLDTKNKTTTDGKDRKLPMFITFTNIILLFSKGMPKTIAAFGLRNFLDDIGCKSVAYLESVT